MINRPLNTLSLFLSFPISCGWAAANIFTTGKNLTKTKAWIWFRWFHTGRLIKKCRPLLRQRGCHVILPTPSPHLSSINTPWHLETAHPPVALTQTPTQCESVWLTLGPAMAAEGSHRAHQVWATVILSLLPLFLFLYTSTTHNRKFNPSTSHFVNFLLALKGYWFENKLRSQPFGWFFFLFCNSFSPLWRLSKPKIKGSIVTSQIYQSRCLTQIMTEQNTVAWWCFPALTSRRYLSSKLLQND